MNDGAKVTVQWREVPNQDGSRAINPSHEGACAVYMKKVDSALEDNGKLSYDKPVHITSLTHEKAREMDGLRFSKTATTQVVANGAPTNSTQMTENSKCRSRAV